MKPAAGSVIKSSAAPATDEVALAGQDGAQLARLLGKSKAYGVKVMADIVAGAIGRFKGTAQLLNHAEVTKLADALAAVNATADLLGRVRVREQADRANVWQGRDAPQDAPFQRFAAEAPGVMVTPEAAVEYFTSLQPELGIDPKRYGQQQRRSAFTLAASANQMLTARVQKAIADALRDNTGAADATANVRRFLESAGVSPRNPQYSEMVVRTNMMDSYQQAYHDEGMSEDIADQFPVWRYLGIDDGRAGEDHKPRFDKYFPKSAAFSDVRGPRVFNCRCCSQWIDKFDWEKEKERGAREESKW